MFSQNLQPDVCYRVVISGVFSYSPPALFFRTFKNADAMYLADDAGNFSESHRGLSVNGKPLADYDSYTEDRHSHEYSFLIDGAGQRLAFQLWPPSGTSSSGSLTVAVRPAPAGIRTSADRAAGEAAARASADEHEAKEKAKAERLEQLRAKYGTKVGELQARVKASPNFLDPAFCRDFLEKHRQELLGIYRGGWVAEYEAAVSDPDLREALRAFAPEVLTWHERRLELLAAAERSSVMLPPEQGLAAAQPRLLTASTLPYVQQLVTDLFRLTEDFDTERRLLAEDQNEVLHRPNLQRVSRALAFRYQELERFGLKGARPEDIEMQLFSEGPPPAPTIYEEVMARIRRGEQVSPEILMRRLQDLHRDESKYRGWRQAAIFRHNLSEVDALDHRLEACRRESLQLKAFLESINCAVELASPKPVEREPDVEDKLKRLGLMEKRLVEFFVSLGQPERGEHIKALVSNELAKICEADDDTY